MLSSDIQYDCALSDGTGSDTHRTITIGPDRAGGGLVLVDSGKRQLLMPVPGAPERLFASSLYAWKMSGTTGVLTDANAIQSYNCRQISSARSITLTSPYRTVQ